jgi:hypothetical protein
MGDINTHSRLWSLEGSTPLSWATTFNDWIGDQGLQCLNPEGVPTWRQGDSCPSVINLVLANEPALISA